MKIPTVVYNPHQLILKPLVYVPDTNFRGFRRVKTGPFEFWPEYQVATMVVSVKKHEVFVVVRVPYSFNAVLFARFLR